MLKALILSPFVSKLNQNDAKNIHQELINNSCFQEKKMLLKMEKSDRSGIEWTGFKKNILKSCDIKYISG